MGPLVDCTSHTMVRVGCPVTKEHSRRECLCDPAMPGTRGHAGPLLLSATAGQNDLLRALAAARNRLRKVVHNGGSVSVLPSFLVTQCDV